MAHGDPDIEPDIEAASDRAEPTALMEPLLLGEAAARRAGLPDLALELGLPLCLAFPAALASRWMPGLFPERAS
jgi:hypothetical protein